MSNFIQKNKKIIGIGLVFIFFIILCSLFPYEGDDWAWGSSIGLNNLQNFFKDYNGRYAGNLIVLALTRSVALRIGVMAITLLGIVYLSYKLICKENFTLFLLATLLLLAIPRLIFRQAIAWTSGFTNYAIPTVLILLYFYLLNKNEKKSKKVQIIFDIGLFILGFCTSLFVEHVTIYIIVITAIIMICEFIKNKKVSAKYIVYFLGAILGAIVMFSNGAYTNIANSSDQYRNVPTSGMSSVIKKVCENFEIVYQNLILNNTILNIILAILLVYIVYQYWQSNKPSKEKRILLNLAVFSVIGYIIYMLIKCANPSWNITLKYTPYFECIISVIFFLAIMMVTLLCIDSKQVKQKILFYWISIGILTVPLFIVQPIGGRCFLPAYCMFILIILELYHLCIKTENSILSNIIITGIIIVGIYLSSVYGYIFKINNERIKYINKQVSEGKKVVQVINLPYQEYLWHANPPKNSIWEERLKIFYHVPKQTKIKYITVEQWHKISNKQK